MSLSSLFGPPPRPSQVTQLFGQQLAQPSAPRSGIFNFAAQPAQPASIEWYVRDNCHSKTLGSLKVYLFQKNPDIKFIRTWKDALTQKINQYNQAQYNNTNQDVYVDKTYILGINLCNTNHKHFNTLLTNFTSDTNEYFCGDEMNGGYLGYTIENKNRICMFVTSEKDGEERLHSVVTFIKDPDSVNSIYVDVLCTCTVANYVNFKGGYRIMALLYGICRQLGYSIRLHSLNAPINFYKSWGFESTGNAQGGLPEFTSQCDSRSNYTFKEAAKMVSAAKTAQTAFALAAEDNAEATLIDDIDDVNDNNVSNVLDVLDREYSTDSNASESTASIMDANENPIVVNDTAITEQVLYNGKLSNVFDKYEINGIVKYDLYIDNEDGTMIMQFGISEFDVETMEQYRKRIASEKSSYGNSITAPKKEDRYGNITAPKKEDRYGNITARTKEDRYGNSIAVMKRRMKNANARAKMPGGSPRKTKRNSKKRGRTRKLIRKRKYTGRK